MTSSVSLAGSFAEIERERHVGASRRRFAALHVRLAVTFERRVARRFVQPRIAAARRDTRGDYVAIRCGFEFDDGSARFRAAQRLRWVIGLR